MYSEQQRQAEAEEGEKKGGESQEDETGEST